MTQAQIKKLRTILAKLEALQSDVGDRPVQDRLQSAKNELLRAIREVES